MKDQDQNVVLKSRAGTVIKYTHEGSLGLLALGDVGLHLWRQLKREHAGRLVTQDSGSLQSNTQVDQ